MHAEQTQLTGAEQVAWDLSDLYAGIDDPALAADMQRADEDAAALERDYRGDVATLAPDELAEAVARYEAIVETATKVESFAHLIWSTDTANPRYGGLLQKATEWSSQLQQKLVFFTLEWVNAPDHVAHRLIEAPELAHYRHWLEVARLYQPHMLSEAEEKILAEKSVTGREAWVRFFTELRGSARYTLDGQSLNESAVLARLYDADREVRRRAAAALTEGLRAHLPMTTFIFNTLAADKASDDRLRRYPTWIAARNLSNEVSDETVEALIAAVTGRYDIVARYYTLKRRILGLDELTDYDRYAPLPAAAASYRWDEARETVLQAYARFHPEVASIAGQFFERNWIDAAERPNKRGGAYSASTVPSAHPYVFMNYTGRVRDVMTLAHELGHGVHQYLARGQGMLQAHTPLTTAEMASTFGEMLVFTDLMERERDPHVRLALLGHKLEDSFATIFRQVSMNRFEHGMHTARREEGELTAERLSDIWLETQRAMFGDSVRLTGDYGVWWSYVPHFLHTPGYVYAYAFGELLVLALFAIYRQQGDGFAPRYLEVLRAGGSDWPEKVLAPLGVDLTDPGFWQRGLDELDAMVTQAEEIS
ncbi:MAG TPA: M3 family oligoendopeptidase [Aggregatilineaceae bacterium]|nr:M3 family oligoendopeptidase [Anaerolineae bacterium]HMM29998.1 M3 family oligoendopeptidase [Aggregatilineaceae bacterium]